MYVKAFWMCLTLSLFIYFIYQCTLVLDKYRRNDKIVNVELQFESAAFPAITVCNLNPFKRHLARTVPEISETLDAFHQAVTYSKDAANHYVIDRSKRSLDHFPGGFRYVQFEPVLSDCECMEERDRDCKQKDSVPPSNFSVCICNYDRQDSSAWPCFNATTWLEAMCPDCNDIGYCNLPETTGSTYLPCLCQMYGKYCLLRPERLKRIWEFRGRSLPDKASPFRADFLEQLKQLGYENMTDEVAITTKTVEKMVLTMAGLPVHRRIALSYGKAEFIHMCSFNGKQCDIVRDFKLHVDPAFGNCYTFNAKRDRPLVSDRAGPSYGLRLMVFVNATDYLPTTEATGVRIAIHSHNEYPFPDTFGYSAPTGAVSSFGLSVRKVNRLSQPYGDCVPSDRPLPDNYIYRNYKYEPEGCFKSCYQTQIYKTCGCADPRYPMQNNSMRRCDSLNVHASNTLTSLIVITLYILIHNNHTVVLLCSLYVISNKNNVEGTVFYEKEFGLQAVIHVVATTPVNRTFILLPTLPLNGPQAHFRLDSVLMISRSVSATIGLLLYMTSLYAFSNHAAMIEIYYEQMSYEKLTESVSYLVVNLISDIGGQAGLWLGASVITLLEVVIFVFRILTMYCRRSAEERKKSVLNDIANNNQSNGSDKVCRLSALHSIRIDMNQSTPNQSTDNSTVDNDNGTMPSDNRGTS